MTNDSDGRRAGDRSRIDADAGTRRFALAIGYNGPPTSFDSGLDELRFADDDALRWARLFAQAGSRTWLATRLRRGHETYLLIA